MHRMKVSLLTGWLDCDAPKTPRQAECARSVHVVTQVRVCVSLVSTTKSEGVGPERHMESNITLIIISNGSYFEFIMGVAILSLLWIVLKSLLDSLGN